MLSEFLRPIDILFGILLPLLIGTALAFAFGGSTSSEFWIARICFVLAAIDAAYLIVCWIWNRDSIAWRHWIAIPMFAMSVIALPVSVMWVNSRETSAETPIPRNGGVLKPKEILLSSADNIANRSIEIGDSGKKFGGFNFYGSKLFVELVDGKAKVTTEIRNENGDLVAEIIRNEWQLFPPAWDKNYNDYALEVRNSKGRIVLQVKVLPNSIQIQGEWWGKDGHGARALKTPQGGVAIMALTPSVNPDEPAIQPIFRYPSSLHFGEMLQ